MSQQGKLRQYQEDLPPSLECALREPGDYAVRLRTGEVVRFSHAEGQGSFVTLFATDGAEFPHGLEVRISDVTWCARGPGHDVVPQSPPPGVPEYSNTAPSSTGVRVPLRVERANP